MAGFSAPQACTAAKILAGGKLPSLIMKVRANPSFDVFQSELRRYRKLFKAWDGIAFRSVTLEFAKGSQLVDGIGSYKHGGRWAAPRSFRSVNLSTTEAVAVEESRAHFSYYHINKRDVKPRLIVALEF